MSNENRSSRTGRLICQCGKGYACENPQQPHYGECRICYVNGLSASELRKQGLKRL